MQKSKQTKLLALALAIMLAVVSTIMILGIQVSFNQNDEGAKITAPVVCAGLCALLILFKFIKKEKNANLIARTYEKSGKKAGPYMTLFFAHFDLMIVFGILSVLSGIISGVLTSVYNTMRFESLINWSYTLSRMAIVFVIYILCLVIYTVGNMIAYSQENKKVEERERDERV